jgi:diguanylate cyclase (GGDEF)-like protein
MRNREQIFAAIDAQILQAGASERLAVLAIHTHGLRDVALRFGYELGDLAATAAGRLISQSLRPVDTVFRAGDSSFIALMPGMQNANHALLAASRLTSTFASPLTQGATPWHGRAITGIAVYPDHGTSAERLCRHAELAHDEAQRRSEPYAMYQHRQDSVEISYEDLHEAITTNRLQTYFQPVWDMRSARLVGVESLARWQHPKHGDVPPDLFVTLAEQSNLISYLTRWSINATLRHAAVLRKTHDMSVAINFSPRVFNESGLVEQLVGALEIWGVPPTSVVAEVTETALVNDLELSVRVLRRMRDHGIRIAIDDFGSGYASFSYLSRFPATELKIDKSFVSGMLRSNRECQLVRAMVDIAHHLDLSAIAEGIEDQATHDLLADMGCDLAQGYYLGRPEPAEQLVARLADPANPPPTPTLDGPLGETLPA